MKDTELRRERDRAVYRKYLEGLRTQDFRNMHEAADWVRRQEAPKFFISSSSLSNYIGAMINGSNLSRLHASTKQKVRILYRMYRHFLELNPNCNLSRERICEILVDQPAPSFFIGHDITLVILQKERKRHHQEIENRMKR